MIQRVGLIIVSTLAIYSTHLSMLALFCGVGIVARRAFGPVRAANGNWFLVSFWMGLAMTTWFLILWNFVFPVNGVVFCLVVVVGLLGLYSARRELVGLTFWRQKSLVALLVIGGLWLANRAIFPMHSWDSELYHLQGIKWARAYAVVPGLANLYGPLGFNNSSFLYDALVQAGPWGQFAHHVANSTLTYAALVQCLIALFHFHKHGPSEPRYLLDFLFLAPVVAYVNPEVSSFSTDLPMTLVLFAAVSSFFVFLTTVDEDPNESAYRVVTVTTLLCLAVCIKFGSAVFAAIAWSMILGVWLVRRQADSGLRWKAVRWSLAIAVGMGVAWIARGIVLSGYPVFPNTIGALPVGWRSPLEHAQAEFALIVHSGRCSATLLGVIPNIDRFSEWFPRWLPRIVFETPFDVLVPAALASISIIVYLWLKKRPALANSSSQGWLLLIPVVPAIASWFVVAPELRYATYLFWTLAAVCCTQTVLLLATCYRPRRLQRWTLILGVLIGSGPTVVNPMLSGPWSRMNRVNAIITWNATTFPIGSKTRLKIPELETFVTESGLQLQVPVRNGGRCINAPLPCTPNPAPNLRLREAGNLGGGFVVDGEWQMQGWPYDWILNLLPALRTLKNTVPSS